MKKIIKSKYAPYFLAGLVINLICAWFSNGFHQADEHFQILEFCSCKMGNTPAAYLPWEFHEKIRATLLPDIAWVIAKVMTWCGVYNPFTLSFLLRLFTVIASWFITCRYCLLLYPKFKTPKGEKLFILLSLFLWFLPYLNVRYTAENVSGIIFLYAIYGIVRDSEKNIFSIKSFINAGFLIGISFFIRFQMMFAITGLVAWLLFIKKIKIKFIFILAIAALAGIGLNVLADYWYYGEWVFTPYNYYYANIIQHKADSFGVSPWWFYLQDFILKAVPPISLLLLGTFFAGIYKNRKDLFVWIIIPFIVLHFFTGHKELRFMFPVTFLFVYVSSLGFDYFLSKESLYKINRYFMLAFWIICIPLLLYRSIAPAQAAVSYCKYLDVSITDKNSILFKLKTDYDVTIYGLMRGFYKNPVINIIEVDSLSKMNDYLQMNHPPEFYYITEHPPMNDDFSKIFPGYKSEMVYCLYPGWISKFNFNNWIQRNHIQRIYRFSKKE